MHGIYKGRGKDGIQWRTVELIYSTMLNSSLEGYFRHYCLLMLLAIADESQSVYREPDDWMLKAETGRDEIVIKTMCVESIQQEEVGEVSKTPVTTDPEKKVRFMIKTEQE